jgi:hypothetical protein
MLITAISLSDSAESRSFEQSSVNFTGLEQNIELGEFDRRSRWPHQRDTSDKLNNVAILDGPTDDHAPVLKRVKEVCEGKSRGAALAFSSWSISDCLFLNEQTCIAKFCVPVGTETSR